MRNYLTAIVGGVLVGFLLAGCHDDDRPPSTPPAPSATGFEAYAVQLIHVSTCESTDPVQTNGIEFSFAADQDTADPRDVSMDAPACTMS
jgi:hypothetical protein